MCKRFRTQHMVAARLLWTAAAGAVSKPHVIAFSKWTSAKWYAGGSAGEPLGLKIRGLFVDTRLKEYMTGLPHDVTDRLFVERRVFRLNDTLPIDPGPAMGGCESIA